MGTPATSFDVHIGLLRTSSPFFDRLFNNHSLQEIQSNHVPLPDEDPDLFGDMISWIYRGTLSQYMLAQDTSFFLFRLWVLAAKFEMPALQNYVMSHFLVVLNTHPGGVYDTAQIDFVYASTHHDSPLRRLAVDMWARNGRQAGSPELLQSLPHSFLGDLCAALLGQNEIRLESDEISFEDFEKRYYVPVPTDEDQSKKRIMEEKKTEQTPSPAPQRATQAQMERRRIITPKSRVLYSPGPLRYIANDHRPGCNSDEMWERRRMS